MLLPFQVILDSGSAISSVMLHNFNTEEQTDITASLVENRLKIKRYEGFALLKYPGTFPVVEIKYEGRYYITIELANGNTLYSEVFTVVSNVDKYLLIEYSNTYNFDIKGGVIDFFDNFVFKCYLDTQLGRPEYDFEEEATERMGYTFIESQVSKKIFKFTFLAPEYLCDALRIVRLCDNKKVTSNSVTHEMLTFNMTPEWEEQGDLASVECEFEEDNIIANVGGYAPELPGGDFNSDYNNDYKIN